MSYRQGIRKPLPTPDELMEGAERNKRLDPLQREVAELSALAEGVDMDGPPDPLYTEEEKALRAKESWRYNKDQGLLPEGEVPPAWGGAAEVRGWQPLPNFDMKIAGPGTTEAAVEDEALRRRVRDQLLHLRMDLDRFAANFNELMGRYEALFALAETYAKASPVDRNGVYVSRKPRENVPGTDRL